MLTPAAKKRRVEAANATLKKPFRSPLIKPKPALNSAPNGSRPSTPLRDVENAASDDESLSTATRTEPAAPSPERRHKSVKAPGATRTARASGLQPPRDDLSGLLAEFERTLAEADKQLREEEDLAEQAAGIRRESERRRPGEEVDVELKELVVTWKAASRLAADEVFEIVKARVAREGGTKAWSEMQQRQREFLAGMNDPIGTKPAKSGEGGDTEGSSQAYCEGTSQQPSQEKLEEKDDGEDSEFTMSNMLDSLNIPTDLLGYDEEKGDWGD